MIKVNNIYIEPNGMYIYKKYSEMTDEELHLIYNFGEGNRCVGGGWDIYTLEYSPCLTFDEWKKKVIEEEKGNGENNEE
jgi:hypothetical protein